MTTKEKMNPNMTARIAGFLYLLVTVFSVISMVAKNLIVP